MVTSVQLGFVLPDEYTPLEAYERKIAELEKRLAAVEGTVDPTLVARVDTITTELTAVGNDVATIKQQYVTSAAFDELASSVGDATTSLAAVQGQIGDFNFSTGDAAALKARGTLDAHEVYVVVDTPDNLSELAANDTQDLSFSLVFGSA